MSTVQMGSLRVYRREDVAVVYKTKERFGGLSNMASGFPLRVNGIHILTTEALYQACRFPFLTHAQRDIIAQRSPMAAKLCGKPYREHTRKDWEMVRHTVMRWCLRAKLAQNYRQFSRVLADTGNKPIVEQSYRDDYWGAKPTGNDTLTGQNVLGRLLMELRMLWESTPEGTLRVVRPPEIPDFLLYGEPIATVCGEMCTQRDTPETKNPNTTSGD